jgi:hypothetical protein
VCKIDEIIDVFTEKIKKSAVEFSEKVENEEFLDFEKRLGELFRSVQVVVMQEIVSEVFEKKIFEKC